MLGATLLHGAKQRRSVNHSEVAEQRQNEILLLYHFCHASGAVDLSACSRDAVDVASSM